MAKKLRFQEIVDKFAMQLSEEDRERLVRLYDLDPLYFQRSRVQVLNALRMLDVYSLENPEGLLSVADVLERRDLIVKFSDEIQAVKEMKTLRRRSSSVGINLPELYAHADLDPMLEISLDHLEIMKSHVKLMRKITAHRFAHQRQLAKQIKKHLAAALEFLTDCAESLVQAGEVAGYRPKNEPHPTESSIPIGVSETASLFQPPPILDPVPFAGVQMASIQERDHVPLLTSQDEEAVYANIGRGGLSSSHSDQVRPQTPEQMTRGRPLTSKHPSLTTHERSSSVDSTHRLPHRSRDSHQNSPVPMASSSPAGSPKMKRKAPQPPPKPHKDTPKASKETTPPNPPLKPKQESSRTGTPLPPPPTKSKPVMAAKSPVQVVLTPAAAAAGGGGGGERGGTTLPRRHSRHLSLELDQDGYTAVLYPGKNDDSTMSTGDSGIIAGEWPVPVLRKSKHEYQSLQSQTTANGDDDHYDVVSFDQ